MLLAPDAEFKLLDGEFLLPTLEVEAIRQKRSDELYGIAENENDYENITLKLIPYHAFANRGESEMRVWLTRKI